ncbi:hypothetical protein [Hydrogenophaga sp. MI9]|uniref:hypothetical protein n=1 Tax=Hydrogenophaga sp. MI9 TaxID=3453719 RepID=UPI003EEC8BC7
MSTLRKVFQGSENPRQLRAILELLRRNLWREEVDAVAGASNGPDVVAQLRRQGLELPCKLVTVTDRDGRKVRAGQYSLTAADRRLFYRWLSNRIKGNTA